MKNNKEWIFFALVSLFSFSSCIQDEILQSEEQKEKYIRINVPKLEKGTVSDLAIGSRSILYNDPGFFQQWGLSNSNDIDVNALKAWDWADGKKIKVAIIDTGVDKTHPDLSNNISSLSYDAMTGTSPSRIYDKHGTCCAGVIGAVRNNGIGIVGIAPNVEIMPVSLDLDGSVKYSQMVNAINWAWQNGADVINMSLTCDPNDKMTDAIKNALTKGRNGKGCVVVAASGNQGQSSVGYPANIEGVIAVGSIDRNGVHASDANYGKNLDFVAPGVNVLTTILNGKYDVLSGTSLAAPMISGIAALLLSLDPEATASKVYWNMVNACRKLPQNTHDKIGHGLVDAYLALMMNKLSEVKEEIYGSHFKDSCPISYSVPEPFDMEWVVTSNYVEPSLSDEDTTVTKVVRTYKGQHIEILNTKKGAGIRYDVEGYVVDKFGQTLKTLKTYFTSGPPSPMTGTLQWQASSTIGDHYIDWETGGNFDSQYPTYDINYSYEPFVNRYDNIGNNPQYAVRIEEKSFAEIEDFKVDCSCYRINFRRASGFMTDTFIWITTDEGEGRPFRIQVFVE